MNKTGNLNHINIDKLIIEKIFNDKNKLHKVKLKLKDEEELVLSVFKYKNDFPLILDEVKRHFTIFEAKYIIVIIDNVKYIAYKDFDNIPLKEYLKYNNLDNTYKKYELQQVFIFNYIMCINSNFEDKIYVFPSFCETIISDMRYASSVFFKVINEKSYKYDSDESEISKRILKEWFDDSLEKFQEMSYEMVKGINPEKLKWELERIVSKYDNNYVSWINSVYNKVKEVKGMYKSSKNYM